MQLTRIQLDRSELVHSFMFMECCEYNNHFHECHMYNVVLLVHVL